MKIRVPPTMEELLTQGGQELGMGQPCVAVREAATEALIKDVAAIADGSVIWLMLAEEEEAQFS